MSRIFIVALAMLLSTGCVMRRELTFTRPPQTLPLGNGAAAAPIDRKWAIGEIYVEPQLQLMQAQGQGQVWSKAREQLQQRINETLRAQSGLGERVEDRASADVIVDISVKIHDTQTVNGWLAAGIASEFVILGAGTATGAGIGTAVDHNGSSDGAFVGAMVGLGVSTIPAILVPLLLPSYNEIGGMDATLNFRRASDGVSVLERHTTVEWEDEFNVFGIEAKLARITGRGAEELEEKLIPTLAEGLRNVPAQNAPLGTAHVEPSRLYAADAPLR